MHEFNHQHRKVDAAHFSMVPGAGVQRSAFDVRHTHKTTFQGGYLVPVYVDEVLPGDSMRVRMAAFCRLATPIVPAMDNLYLESFFFFVPLRILWANFTRFMGETNDVAGNPGDSTVFLTPQVVLTAADVLVASLWDYLGITVNNNGGASLGVTAFHHRAYNKIWNDWFRDQDLQPLVTVDTGDGPDAAANYVLLRRNKRFDYFTSARPWPLKPMNIQRVPGSLDTVGALGGGAWSINSPSSPGYSNAYLQAQVGAPLTGLGIATVTPAAAAGVSTMFPGGRNATPTNQFSTGSVAFLADAGPGAGGGAPDIKVLINDLRTASLIQRFMEQNARGGTRYTEMVREHFRVLSPDSRLQRSEFLGGGQTLMSINPVAQTSASGVAGTTTVLGQLAAVGTGLTRNHGFSQSFTEHGVIIGLVNVRADLSYQGGTHRMFSRRTQFDYFWPGFEGLGEQKILVGEIFCQGSGADAGVFGYQERYAEYKWMPSRISGFFRSVNSAGTPLDMWHFADKFTSAPSLGNTYIRMDDAPINRVLQTSQNFGQQFLMDAEFEVRKVRPMRMFSIPGVGARL